MPSTAVLLPDVSFVDWSFPEPGRLLGIYLNVGVAPVIGHKPTAVSAERTLFKKYHTFLQLSKRMRSIAIFGIVLVALTALIAAEEEYLLENIKDEAGNLLTLNITHKEAEEDIDVLNDKGEPVIKVEIHEHEGYQIDKPANDSVCLLSGNDENENETFCYNRIEYPAENVTSALQEHCEGRDIFVLVPTDCAQPDEIGGSETEMMSGEGRFKRSWRCYSCSYYTLRYVKVTRCCGWYFIFCTRKCFVRYEYRWVRITYYTCAYYWGK